MVNAAECDWWFDDVVVVVVVEVCGLEMEITWTGSTSLLLTKPI